MSDHSCWTSVAELAVYYSAISTIRDQLESCTNIKDMSGFIRRPEPNPYYCRTPSGLYLETTIIGYANEKGDEILRRLWSPFGEVELLGGGWLDKLKQVSTEFMSEMSSTWVLCDVSRDVNIYSYTKDKLYGPCKFNYTYNKTCSTTSRLYQIKSINNRALPFQHGLTLYSDVSDIDYKKDNDLFIEVSGGKKSSYVGANAKM